MGIESTTFGGAFSAGKRANEEEKQRVMDAIKKGKTVNPLVSFARATFFGLAYTVKDATLGSLEYTKNKLVEIDQEIKGTIKSYVKAKYANIRADEQTKRVAQHKVKQKQTKNKKFDALLKENKNKLQKNKKNLLNFLDVKLEKEKIKAENTKVSEDVFSESFTAGEKRIQAYKDKVISIEEGKKEIAQIKSETAATQRRVEHQWDGFAEGLAAFGGALNEGVKEYQKSKQSYKLKDDSWKEDKDNDYDANWNKKVVDAYKQPSKAKRTNSTPSRNTQQAIQEESNDTYCEGKDYIAVRTRIIDQAKMKHNEFEISSKILMCKYKTTSYNKSISICGVIGYHSHNSNNFSFLSKSNNNIMIELLDSNDNIISKCKP